MTIREADRKILNALETAREQRAELAGLLAFYHELYEVQFRAKAALAEPDPSCVEMGVVDAPSRRLRLDEGHPQVTVDELSLQPEAFARLVMEVSAVLLRHDPAWEIRWQDWTPDRLVARARQSLASSDALALHGLEAQNGPQTEHRQEHAVALSVGFALAPYLQWSAEAILPLLDLTIWVHGTCPICGGRPDLAMLEKERGARQLLCSRCNSLWDYTRVGCPFCRSKQKQNYFVSDDGVYRLYVCPDCRRYLKTVDLRELQRPVIPVVERLLTAGMDVAARQQGYGG